MPDYQTKQYITEFHSDVVKSTAALPAASSYSGYRVFYLNQEWYSDGTRWLSVQLYSHPVDFICDTGFNPVGPHLLPAGTSAYATASWPNINLYPVEFELHLWQANVGSAVNFYGWTGAIFTLTGGVGGEPALNTKTIAASTWTTYKWTTAAGSMSGPVTPGSDPTIFNFTSNGTPGKLLMTGKFEYRKVGV